MVVSWRFSHSKHKNGDRGDWLQNWEVAGGHHLAVLDQQHFFPPASSYIGI